MSAPDPPPGWQPPPQPPHGGWQPPPQSPQGSWSSGQPPTPSSPTSGKATAALVLGICGILVCPVVLSIAALVLGYQARGEIDRSGGAIGGRGMAVGGIVLGWIGIVLGLLLIALFLVIGFSATQFDGGEFDFETISLLVR